MISANLTNGCVLRANDLGQELQLRIVPSKGARETWRIVERTSKGETFANAAKRHFGIIALAENAQIVEISA